ncbi:MAG: TIGR02646 family protein [Thermoflexaceae bacterium]|nr:TIGR02646 family protein [Thermoflexaceae bacterium]
MIYIEKKEEPVWLLEYKQNNPEATYDSESFAGYREQLRDELILEQHSLCAYCCSHINNDKAHNEHIEPRHPRNGVSLRSLDYSNIVASCNNKSTCGSKKKNEYDSESFVSPLNPDCEDVFTYYPDGVMEGNQYTIDLLNLNAYELKEARKAVYKIIKDLDKETIKLIYCQEQEELPAFYNVISWYIKNNV